MMVVTPPHAPATVPVKKSSAVVIPSRSMGWARWVWVSMPPGMTQ